MYYVLKYSTSPDVVGIVPQCHRAYTLKGGRRSGADVPFLPIGEPASNVHFPIYLMHPKAKQTDVLNTIYSYSGILVSERLKNILQQFHISEYQIFPITVEHYGNQKQYYLFNFYQPHLDYILFEESDFYIVKGLANKVGDIKLSSLQEYLEIREKINLDLEDVRTSIKLSKLVLNYKNIKNDLFRLTHLISIYIVSESMKNIFIKQGITGVDFLPVDQFKIR